MEKQVKKKYIIKFTTNAGGESSLTENTKTNAVKTISEMLADGVTDIRIKVAVS
jgi:hypothetical protein